jgi:hypothetical protein
MINGLSHVSIAVPNLEAAARELSAKYGGLEWERPW